MFTIRYLDGRVKRVDLSLVEVIRDIKSNTIDGLAVAPHRLGSMDIESLIKAAFESHSTVKMDLTCFGIDSEVEGMLKALPKVQCTILDSRPRVVNLDESIPIATRASADGRESYGSPGHKFLVKYLDGRAEGIDLSLAEVIRVIKGNMVNSLEACVHNTPSSGYIKALIKIAYESHSTVKMNLTCFGLDRGSEEMLQSLPSIQCTILDGQPRVINLDESVPITTRISEGGKESYGVPGNEFTIRYLDGRVEEVNLSLPESIRIIKGNMLDGLAVAPHRHSSGHIQSLIKIAYEYRSAVKMNLAYFGIDQDIGDMLKTNFDIKISKDNCAHIVNINSSDISECKIAGLASEAVDTMH